MIDNLITVNILQLGMYWTMTVTLCMRNSIECWFSTRFVEICFS